jgi:N-acetylglucosamine-6-phosphate deacetylase
LVQWGICEVESVYAFGIGEAIALATEAPRQAISLPGIAVGQPAQLLRWHLDEDTSQLTWQRLARENSPQSRLSKREAKII